MTNPFLSGAVGALSATISVLLVLLYGASATKFLPHILTEEVINSVTKLGTNILLPCLLFTEMGKEASPSQLKEFWILPVFNICFTLLSLLYSWIGIKLFKFPNWLAPAAAFPNMLSLPLLLIESLSSSGVLDDLLMGKSDTVEKALDRAKIYFLVNGLAGNIVRFALGPYLLNGSDDSDNSDGKKQPERRGVSQDPERAPLLGNAQPGQTLSVYANGQGDGQAEQPEDGAVKATAKQAGYKIADFLNPPLVAAILAIAFGLIGPVRRTLFEEEGALNANFTQSIKTLGKLYTGMQMFILGGKLVSKKAGRAKILPLLYLFLWRFVLVPLIAIGLVYGLRHRFPAYIKEDPMLDFVLAISYVGPPAITLAAIADMSGMDQEEQGVIATVLLASYVFTPFMSLPVSGAMSVISKLYQ